MNTRSTNKMNKETRTRMNIRRFFPSQFEFDKQNLEKIAINFKKIGDLKS